MRNIKPYLYITILGILVLILYGSALFNAQADYEIIPYQTSFSDEGNYDFADPAITFLMQLGTGHSGFLTGVTLRARAVASSGASAGLKTIRIVSISNSDPGDVALYNAHTPSNDAGYDTERIDFSRAGDQGTNGFGFPIGTTGEKVVYATSTGFFLEEGRTYWLELTNANNTNWDIRVLGIDNFSYSEGTITPLETGLTAPYMLFEGEGTATNTNTRIIESITPTQNSTTASTSVSFSFTYYYGDTDDVDVAGFLLHDITTGFQYVTPEKPILASGQSTYTATSTLISGNFHMWRPYLRDTDSGEILYTGVWQSFNVVTNNNLNMDFIDPETGLNINASSTSFWDFLNVPELLKTKAPTGYIYQYASLLLNLSVIPATSTPIFTLPAAFASTSIPQLAGIEIFSIDTIEELMPSWFISTMRTLLAAILWITFAFAIIHKSEHIFS